MTITAASFTVVSKNYTDAGCTQTTYSSTSNGTYSVPSTQVAPAGAAPMDSAITDISMAVADSALVTQVNEHSFYGYNDWAVNAAKDITGRHASASDTQDPADMLRTTYGIFQIINGKLYFGKTSPEQPLTTAAQRPKALDMTKPYTKLR
jgi:hypothetical protein